MTSEKTTKNNPRHLLKFLALCRDLDTDPRSRRSGIAAGARPAQGRSRERQSLRAVHLRAHGINANGTVINVGFHYNSDCNGLDREAYGTLSNFTAGSTNATWSATADTARDNALTAAGYPGKHGGRADIWWRGYRFSLQEAQNNATGINDQCYSPCTTGYRSFRAVIYDYQAHTVQAVPFHTAGGTSCYGNPSITLLQNPSGAWVFAVSLFLFSECVPRRLRGS